MTERSEPRQRRARALGDPTRYALFETIATARAPVSVAELVDRFGLHHNAIRQHLAKLVGAGLVSGETAGPTSRGRRPVRYSLTPTGRDEWNGPSAYERLSRMLATAISTGTPPQLVGRRAAAEYVASPPTTDPVDDMVAAMERVGFAAHARPTDDGAEIELDRCPFESAAHVAPGTVCSLHLGIAEGVAADSPLVVEELVAADPRRAPCRLRVRFRAAGGDPQPARLSLTVR